MSSTKDFPNKSPSPPLHDSSSKKKPVTFSPFVTIVISGLGGATGWLFVHPLDVCKVRLQIDENKRSKSHKPSMTSTLNKIAREEGLKGLYGGLSAAITRQLTYTALRLGLYDIIRDKVVTYYSNKNSITPSSPSSYQPSLGQKLLMGLTSGGIAAALCNPIEVALVRMQSDGAQKDITKKRNYKHIFDALYRVTKEEGVKTLSRGIKPTVARGMIVSGVQLSSYDHAKYLIKTNIKLKEGPVLHLSASIVSGFLYSLTSLPLDICKTRMQNQPSVKPLMYTSIPQTLVKIVANEGVFALWKGFIPYFARSGGHTITMFLCVEQFKNIGQYWLQSK